MADVKSTDLTDPSGTLPPSNDANLWYTLINWNELPHWQQDNHLIHGSYRRASYSYARSFASTFHWHNETINIWTHLVPSLMSLPCALILYNTLKPRYELASITDIWAMSCFFLGAALCLGMSATYHALSNHSPNVAKMWNQLDYVGIACLITGSFVPSVFYGFWCDTFKQKIYWIMICSLGIGCTAVSILPKFRTPTWRPYRAGMFVGMGISAVFPVLDGLITYGFNPMRNQIGLSWLILQGVLYICGAGLYAARIPERWYPGKFDTLGSSHQVFHVLIVLAAISHLIGLIKAFDFRHGTSGSICS